GTADEADARLADGGSKKDPRQQGSVDEDREGDIGVLSHAAQLAEEDGEDDHRHDRLDDGPGRAQHGLLVADLNVAPYEEAQQFPVAPEFADVECLPASARF